MGNILSVLFQLLHCTNVGPYRVHFFFAFEECYQRTWWVSFVALLLIIALFSLVFIKLKRMTISERSDKRHVLNIFVSKYKSKYYYWEIVLLIKRIFIAMFATVLIVNNGITYVLFVIIIFIFIVLHRCCEPFIVTAANNMECMLLLCLCIVIMTHSVVDHQATFTNVTVSFLIMLPFILMIYCIYQFITNKKTDESSLTLLKQRIKYIILTIVWYYASFNNSNDNESVDLIPSNKRKKISKENR
eukprot:117321_1